MGSGRMWALIEKSKKEGLTEEEREELQKLFLGLAQQDVRILLDEGELTECPGCGRIRPNVDCECGYQVDGWVKWCESIHDLRIAEGWRVLKCPPSRAFPNGVGILVHPDHDCTDSCCRFYPTRHRHRVENIEEIVIIEEDKPGGAKRE